MRFTNTGSYKPSVVYQLGREHVYPRAKYVLVPKVNNKSTHLPMQGPQNQWHTEYTAHTQLIGKMLQLLPVLVHGLDHGLVEEPALRGQTQQHLVDVYV